MTKRQPRTASGSNVPQYRNEDGVKAAVKRVLMHFGDGIASYYMPVQMGIGRGGVSDFVICFNGALVLIETKFKDEPTKLQTEFARGMVKAGARAYWIDEKNIHLLYGYLATTLNPAMSSIKPTHIEGTPWLR